jgi:hypothetical protein
MVGANIAEVSVAQEPQVVVLEARRRGRRPRYHRGARLGPALVVRPEQCNLDQVGVSLEVLDELPALDEPGVRTRLRRPWAQLCRRCWRGTDVLATALDAGRAAAEAQRLLREAQAANRDAFIARTGVA